MSRAAERKMQRDEDDDASSQEQLNEDVEERRVPAAHQLERRQAVVEDDRRDDGRFGDRDDQDHVAPDEPRGELRVDRPTAKKRSAMTYNPSETMNAACHSIHSQGAV